MTVLCRILYKSFKQKLEFDDLPGVPPGDQAEELVKKFCSLRSKTQEKLTRYY